METGSGSRRLPLFDKLALADKILVSTLALLLLLGVMGTLATRVVIRAHLEDEIANSARRVATAQAPEAAGLLQAGDMAALATWVQQLVDADRSDSYAIVTDRDGRILAHTFPWDPPAAIEAPAPALDTKPRELVLDDRHVVEVVVPLRAGPEGDGYLRVGSDLARIDGVMGRMTLTFAALLAAFAVFGLMVSRRVSRYVTRPVVELTHLADEVSTGNLDVDFHFGLPVRCWEIKRCQRLDCAAHGNTAVQCWFVDGTPCEGYEPRFPQKLVGCRTCEVYRAHKGDEIVQLADSFRHMTRALGHSQQDLQRSDRFQRGLIRNSFDGIIATDDDDVVRIFNRVAQNLTGFGEDEIIGHRTWEDLFATEMCDALDDPLFQDGATTVFGFYRKEMRLLCKDASTADVLASGITLLDGEQEVGKVFFFKDMREIKQLREDLVRSERLAATGQTVASISHSIKNILDGLRGGVYVYKRGVRIGDEATRDDGWVMVERNVDIISALVIDLLNYARDREPDLAPCDPNDLIADVVRAMGPRAEQLGVDLQSELNPLVHEAHLDAHAVHQCLVNLVTNALDAASEADPGWVQVGTGVGDAGELVFDVSDNGPGVPPRLRDGLFTAMVSSKGSKGTGLGLLVVHKVVSEHGGTVAYLPDRSPGATFRITLPLSPAG